MEDLNEFFVHELIFVGDFEDVNFFVARFTWKPCHQSLTMLGLHDENQVSPFQILAPNRTRRFFTRATRTNMDPLVLGVDLLRRWTSPLIHRAHEKNVDAGRTLDDVRLLFVLVVHGV